MQPLSMWGKLCGGCLSKFIFVLKKLLWYANSIFTEIIEEKLSSSSILLIMDLMDIGHPEQS